MEMHINVEEQKPRALGAKTTLFCTIPYAFANILTVNNAWSTSRHGRVLGRVARRYASAWRAQEGLR